MRTRRYVEGMYSYIKITVVKVIRLESEKVNKTVESQIEAIEGK